MSAALTRSPSPPQADASGSNPEREAPSEARLTFTTQRAPPMALSPEATSDSRIMAIPPQPPATAHYLTKAESQTRSELDAPNSSSDVFTEEGRHTAGPSGLTARVGADSPTLASASFPQKETCSRVCHGHNVVHPCRHRGRAAPPTRLPLSLPGATKRPSTIHFENLGADSSPGTDLRLGRFPAGTVGARLDPTLVEALVLRDQALRRATWIMYSINIAIGLQVLLGAVSVTLDTIVHKNEVEIPNAVLSCFSTVVASFLAAMRGSSEPEYSYLRQNALTNFIRKLEGFILDHGAESGNGHDHPVEHFREEFERLLVPASWSGRMADFVFDRERKKGSRGNGTP